LRPTQAWRCLLPLAVNLLLAAALLTVIPVSIGTAHATGNCTVPAAETTPNSDEQAMLTLMNTYRAGNGAGPLSTASALERSAVWKSTDMAQNHYFSHDDLIRGWAQRLSDCGYVPLNDGEDLAEGYPDAQETFNQWRNSPEHNAIMLDPTYHAVGIGRAESADGTWYWTADFGPTTDSTSSASTSSPSTSAPSGSSTPAATTTTGTAPWIIPPPAVPANSQGIVAVGTTVVTNTPDDCLNAHVDPSLSSSVPVCLPDASPLFLVDGPVTADGHTWWLAFGAGWVAGDYLRPSSSS
jgi:uncharacterized protein YkwD